MKRYGQWVVAVALALAFCACGGGGSADSGTDSGAADAGPVLSSCGHEGDLGNSLGVGRFCTANSDCVGTSARICSALGNGSTPKPDDTYFCTIYPCHLAPDGGTDGGVDAGTATDCGAGATCVCGSSSGSSGCACTPNICIH